MEQDQKSIIDKMIDNMTIEELKAAARVGIAITLEMISKTTQIIKKHIKKGEKK